VPLWGQAAVCGYPFHYNAADMNAPIRRLIVRLMVTLVLASAVGGAHVAAQQPVGTGEADAALLSRIALGFVLATAGGAAIATAAAYWRASGSTMLSVGLLTFLFGTNLLITAGPLVRLIGVSPRSLAFVNAILVYLMPIPGLFYAERVRGRGWFSSLHWLWRASFVLAVVFIALDARARAPWTALRLFRIWVIVSSAVLLPHVLFWRQSDPVESAVRTVGTLALILTLVHDNLAGIGLFSSRIAFTNFGIGVFVLGLGIVTARSFFADQRELAAVDGEMETARTIQASILPHEVPAIAGLDIAVRYVPARWVAGDVYDFLKAGDRRLAILVVDVAGHGVPAALIASMATVAFSSHPDNAQDPGTILAKMNQVFCEHLVARYLTAACVFIDTERRLLRYSLAGHPRPLVWKKLSRQVIELSEGGLVLGVFPDAAYPTGELPLDPGDRVIVYTDGLTEAFNPAGEWFGDTELRSFISRNDGLPADRFAGDLVRRLEQWVRQGRNNHAFEDDLTIVVVDVS
jgi:hypothetical protein